MYEMHLGRVIQFQPPKSHMGTAAGPCNLAIHQINTGPVPKTGLFGCGKKAKETKQIKLSSIQI